MNLWRKRPTLGMPASRTLGMGLLMLAIALFAASLFAQLAQAEEAPAGDSGYVPLVSPASEEGDQAIQRFEVPEGARVSLFAAEPMLANPVAFCTDDQGRFYVAETSATPPGLPTPAVTCIGTKMTSPVARSKIASPCSANTWASRSPPTPPSTIVSG